MGEGCVVGLAGSAIAECEQCDGNERRAAAVPKSARPVTRGGGLPEKLAAAWGGCGASPSADGDGKRGPGCVGTGLGGGGVAGDGQLALSVDTCPGGARGRRAPRAEYLMKTILHSIETDYTALPVVGTRAGRVYGGACCFSWSKRMILSLNSGYQSTKWCYLLEVHFSTHTFMKRTLVTTCDHLVVQALGYIIMLRAPAACSPTAAPITM